MNETFLPFAVPCIGEEEINEVVNTLRSGWLTAGPKTQQFEQEFSAFVDMPYALTVNSATAGLHLALEAIGVGVGDKIITSPYTFTATAEVARYLGADPIFVDIDPRTFNMDTQKLAQALATTDNIKVISPVHFAGQACAMDDILALAKQYQLKVVEDAAHALPSRYKGRLIGGFGDVTAYSFYATKTVTTGEGGMIVTANPEYAKRMKIMRLHGISRDVFDRSSSSLPTWYYEVVAPGFKYNMSDIASAIGIHQLRKAEKLRQRREAIAQRYTEGLQGLPLTTPYTAPENTHAWHLYVIQLTLEDLKIDRNQFIERMKMERIGTSVHFIPLHIQPYWKERYGFEPEDFPVAFDVYQRAVSLPIYPDMTEADVMRVIAATRQILTGARR
ncbi:DegT/DnrJ/EryC1/StrS family aminotransferase [Beggiatoa leptomitoformis]|uniref:Aminotransferase class I/II-fold pyridoxal phosphate-dependent enzyme n=1 Tax=Beggiatoa leptomitoformis TaxID=288004 RepID=A0A2N9YD54_9GAMM|nr:DegT/DnrJ/EryC1/StrS family aminotransferase [Beggiatoa leptomitoformis]ALG69177.1 aminotransferase class I/II-fold pyridoxal phosphate-dependent enzyme [Beggiatoa leptomitoformis]AUI68397.1 aminotransferase class I/II-fold pyridoxal phosphate-dependent enzyme [Beggiatoa leptomitoformis]